MDSSDVLMVIIWAGIGLVCAYFRAEYLLWRETSTAERHLRSRYSKLYKDRSPSNAQNRRSLAAPQIIKGNRLLDQRDHVDAA